MSLSLTLFSYWFINVINKSKSWCIYIDSPDWIQNKKATINPNKKDNKCFQHAGTVRWNHEKIKEDPQRMTKIKPFIKNVTEKE